jgi:hypothetical protein
VGLFSLFKKNAPPLDADATAPLPADSETARQRQQARQREIARATTMKIDAIEAAMAFDIFNQPEPAWGSERPRTAQSRQGQGQGQAHGQNPDPAQAGRGDADGDADGAGGSSDFPTTVLLREDDPPPPVPAHSTPVIEEVAILYASGQSAAARQMLTASIGADNIASANQDRTVWWMLFDLYQVDGEQERFDNLAIDYVSTFETSPPCWNPPAGMAAVSPDWAGVTPTFHFTGMLDAQMAGQCERLLQLADDHPVLRLEFGGVGGIGGVAAPACCKGASAS